MSQMSQLGQGLGAFSQGLAAMSRNNIQKEQQENQEFQRKARESQKYIDNLDAQEARNAADLAATNFANRLHLEEGLWDTDDDTFRAAFDSHAEYPAGASQVYRDTFDKAFGSRYPSLLAQHSKARSQRHQQREEIALIEGLHNIYERVIDDETVTNKTQALQTELAARLAEFQEDEANGITRETGNQIFLHFIASIAEMNGEPAYIADGPSNLARGVTTNGGKTLADSGRTKEKLFGLEQRLRGSTRSQNQAAKLAHDAGRAAYAEAHKIGDPEALLRMRGKTPFAPGGNPVVDERGNPILLDWDKIRKEFHQDAWQELRATSPDTSVSEMGKLLNKAKDYKFKPFTDLMSVSTVDAVEAPEQTAKAFATYETLWAINPQMAQLNAPQESISTFEAIKAELATEIPLDEAVKKVSLARVNVQSGAEYANVSLSDVALAMAEVPVVERDTIFPDYVPDFALNSVNAATTYVPLFWLARPLLRTEWHQAQNPDEVERIVQRIAETNAQSGMTRDSAIESAMQQVEGTYTLFDDKWVVPKNSNQIAYATQNLDRIKEAYLKLNPKMDGHDFTFKPLQHGMLFSVVILDGGIEKRPEAVGIPGTHDFEFGTLKQMVDELDLERTTEYQEWEQRMLKGDGGFIEQTLYDAGQGVSTIFSADQLGEIVSMNAQPNDGFQNKYDIIRTWKKANPTDNVYTDFRDYAKALSRGEKPAHLTKRSRPGGEDQLRPDAEFRPIGGPLEGKGPEMLYNEVREAYKDNPFLRTLLQMNGINVH